jgi:hypothetical protein
MVNLQTQHTPNPNAQSPREIPPERETKNMKICEHKDRKVKIMWKAFAGYLEADTRKCLCTSRSFCHHLISTHRQRAAKRNLSLQEMEEDGKNGKKEEKSITLERHRKHQSFLKKTARTLWRKIGTGL